MNPASRAYRILRHLPSFEGEPARLPESRLPPLRPGEIWIGVYWNEPLQSAEAVAFSDQRVCVCKSLNWMCIAYSSIRHEQVPHSKETAEGVLLSTVSDELYVPIRGKRGNLRDVYEVLRFFKRVREDLSSQTKAVSDS